MQGPSGSSPCPGHHVPSEGPVGTCFVAAFGHLICRVHHNQRSFRCLVEAAGTATTPPAAVGLHWLLLPSTWEFMKRTPFSALFNMLLGKSPGRRNFLQAILVRFPWMLSNLLASAFELERNDLNSPFVSCYRC